VTLQFVVPGPPVGKQRARVTRQGHAYTPSKTANYEALVKQTFAAKYPGHKPLEGPVFMTVKIYLQPPKAIMRKMLKDSDLDLRPTTKPDGSNVAKAIEDAGNGLFYRDDSQIVALHVLKHYAIIPRVEVSFADMGQTISRGEAA
jgi:Holliday junction resolvase RusA-like endonuclease